MYVFLPSHPGAAGIAAASLGIVLSANRFVRLAANSLGGLLSDRLGRRRPYLLGMMLALASTTGYLVSDGLWSLLVWRVVWGVAFSLISVGGVAIVLDLSRAHDRGRTVGNYQSLLQLGSLVGLVLSGLLTDRPRHRPAPPRAADADTILAELTETDRIASAFEVMGVRTFDAMIARAGGVPPALFA
jgi:MFS family permease